MRELLKLLLSLQMVFAPFAFAQGNNIPPVTAATTTNTPAPPPPPKDAPTAPKHDCAELKCNELFLALKDIKEAQDEIKKQLGESNKSQGCKALQDPEFLTRLVDIAAKQTEAGCPKCDAAVVKMRAQIQRPAGGTINIEELKDYITCEKKPAAPATTQTKPPPSTATQEAKPAVPYTQQSQVYTQPPPPPPPPQSYGGGSRPSSYGGRVERVDDGWGGDRGGGGGGLFGGGSFMSKELMWGIGGLAIGGILGYMIGKNSGQNQYNQQPYWQNMGQMGGPFGQVPPRPFQYPGMGGLGGPFGMGGPFGRPGMGGPMGGMMGGQFGGGPNVLPYGMYGQPGYNNNMMPIGGYQGGVGLGNYNLGTQFGGGCGYCSSNYSPNYSYGNAPYMLPAR